MVLVIQPRQCLHFLDAFVFSWYICRQRRFIWFTNTLPYLIMRKNYVYPRLKTLSTIEIFLEKYLYSVEPIENQPFLNHGHLALGQKSKLLCACTGPGSLPDATSYFTWQEAGGRSFLIPFNRISFTGAVISSIVLYLLLY